MSTPESALPENIYERLIDALDALPNGFPRTRSRVEIQLLHKLFAPDEALIASLMSRHEETPDVIAQRAGLPAAEVKAILITMAKRGLLWCAKRGREMKFRLAPFIVGIYEAQMEVLDQEFALLFEEYMSTGGAVGIMRPSPALHRVVPTQGTIKTDWILPYEDVKAILLEGRVFSVRDCICRVQQDLLGKRRCKHELASCLSFTKMERPPRAGDIPIEQALKILNDAETAGLVHTVSNVVEGVFYICNCCGCCCGILRGITDFGIETSVARSNYYAVIDQESCTGCMLCSQRCQVHAIAEPPSGEPVVIDSVKCIGCGLCVSACATESIRLERKKDAQAVHPPKDFAAWEMARLKDRGLPE
ncbi:MAG TPA: 4Fe-4S binding protein [bacterium]